jgi:O-antigen ligase
LAFATVTPADRLAGNWLDRMIGPSMALAGMFLIWLNKPKARETLLANRWLTATILFCQFSILWSQFPDLTLRRALLLLFLSLASLGLAVSIDDFRVFHRRLFHALSLVIVVNLVATAIWPDIAITDIGVAGLYGQKNPAGMVAMIAIVVCVTFAFGADSRNERVFGWLAAAMAFFFLVITRSKTSLALTLVGLGLGFLFWVTQKLGFRFGLLVLAGLAVALATLLGVVMNADFDGQQVLASFVTDTTFTGRDELWAFAWRSAVKAPWLGAGYGAFWDVGSVNDPLARLEPGTWLGDVTVGVINQAHNGYLELFLHIGIPMTLVAVLAVFCALGAAMRRSIGAFGDAGAQSSFAMIALLLLLYLLHNLTEATLMMRGAPFCNLALLLSFACGFSPQGRNVVVPPNQWT